MKYIKRHLIKYVLLLGEIVLLAIIVKKIVLKHLMIPGTDFYYHSIEALNIFQSEGSIKQLYPLWHWGTKFFERVLHFPLFDATVVVTVSVYILILLITFLILRKYLAGKCNELIYVVAAFGILIIQPIAYETLFNRATWGLNLITTWHNPTNPTALAFGLIGLYCLYYVFEIWEQEKIISVKWIIAFSVSNVFSCLAKPSFAQVFLPAITVYCVAYCIRSRFKHFKPCIIIALALVPSLLILLRQFWAIFGNSILATGTTTAVSSNGGVSHGPGMSFSFLSGLFREPGWHWMLLGTYAFPVYVAIVYAKWCWNDKKFIIAWLMAGFGAFEEWSFIETGSWSGNGDFGWGNCIAIFVLFLISMIKFLEEASGKIDIKKIIGCLILILHVWCGCVYLYWQLFVPGFWY